MFCVTDQTEHIKHIKQKLKRSLLVWAWCCSLTESLINFIWRLITHPLQQVWYFQNLSDKFYLNGSSLTLFNKFDTFKICLINFIWQLITHPLQVQQFLNLCDNIYSKIPIRLSLFNKFDTFKICLMNFVWRTPTRLTLLKFNISKSVL